MTVFDDLLRPVLAQISKLWARVDQIPVVRWGTVTAANPLRVQLDGNAEPLPFTPQTTVRGLVSGNRVLCVEQHRRVTIFAVTDTDWVPITTFLNGFSAGASAPAVRLFQGRLELSGTLYRATAPTSDTTAFQIPPNFPRTRSTVRVTTVLGWSCEVQINAARDVQIQATVARTSGAGYIISGVGYVPE